VPLLLLYADVRDSSPVKAASSILTTLMMYVHLWERVGMTLTGRTTPGATLQTPDHLSQQTMLIHSTTSAPIRSHPTTGRASLIASSVPIIGQRDLVKMPRQSSYPMTTMTTKNPAPGQAVLGHSLVTMKARICRQPSVPKQRTPLV